VDNLIYRALALFDLSFYQMAASIFGMEWVLAEAFSTVAMGCGSLWDARDLLA
jgi:hypothetical protein